LLDDEIQLVAICDALQITYTELLTQPAWWVNIYQAYLVGKNKAQQEHARKANRPIKARRR